MDILFHTEDYVFSYRAAGICVQNGKVLLQKPPMTQPSLSPADM